MSSGAARTRDASATTAGRVMQAMTKMKKIEIAHSRRRFDEKPTADARTLGQRRPGR
jgi:hypothetical protein